MYVDTDHAGCLQTRRSASGWGYTSRATLHKGLALHAKRAIALSSGEAELFGVVKGGAGGLGCRSLLEDLGMRVDIEVVELQTDSSAAFGNGK